MRMEPFPKGRRATLLDVIRRQEQVHDCLELNRGDIGELSNQVARLDGKIDGLAQGLGIHPPPIGHSAPHKPPKFTIRWDFKTVAAVAGALSGALLLLKIFNAVLPVAWAALMGVPIR
jgi:hypothetical protein